MSLRSDGRKIPKIHGVSKGHRSQPGQDPGRNGDGTPKKCEGSIKPQRQNSSTEQVHVEGNRQVFTFLLHAEEVFRVDCRVSASVQGVESLSFFLATPKSIAAR